MSDFPAITKSFYKASRLDHSNTYKKLNLQLPVREEDGKLPFLFRGEMANPFIFGKTLRTLSRVVSSRYFIPTNALQRIIALSDPVISVGNHKIRFEGFSTCCGVYAKVDIEQDRMAGVKISNGTTNVDFNTEMLNQLSTLKQDDKLILEIGEEAVSMKKGTSEVIEKKVPLPKRWLMGLANTQAFLSKMLHQLTLHKIEAVQLIRSIPKNLSNKTSLYLNTVGPPRLSPVKTLKSIKINGAERLRLMEQIVHYANELHIYASDIHTVSAWRLSFDDINFTLVISGDVWRGFSGEGQVLNDLIAEVSPGIVESIRSNFKDNDTVSKHLFSTLSGYAKSATEAALAKLAVSGLLGYDLVSQEYYYRELPIKQADVHNLNPRYAAAMKLIQENKVEIVSHRHPITKANVKGTDVLHYITLSGNTSKCTCTWYGKHQGSRGDCKHILAVKLKIKKDE